ncbi:MAG: helix-turn-helix domain-containing protein [Saprospiraceae bacterium]|jgi:DNA-binding HxlR family transcriptional regulator
MKKEQWVETIPEPCPVLLALEEIGDRWIMQILRACFFGYRRFDDIQENLGISRSVLTTKLHTMVDLQLLEKVPYQEGSERTRYEYQLTQKGKDLLKVILALLEWGNKHLVQPGEQMLTTIDKESGQEVRLALLTSDHQRVRSRNIRLVPSER